MYGFANSTLKKLTYQYDRQGNILREGFEDLAQPVTNSYVFYEYDPAGRLSKVYSGMSVDGTGKTQEAQYTYLANGKVKRLQLATAQGLDYQYNERDWLTQINHQNIDNGWQDPGNDSTVTRKDKFGMVIGYNVQAHIGGSTNQNAAPQFNGNISWAIYNISRATVPFSTPLVGNTYSYDNANRLTGSNFGYYSNTSSWQSTPAYDASYSYDAVGNMTNLQCYGRDGNLMDNSIYHYDPVWNGTNSMAGYNPGSFVSIDAGWPAFPSGYSQSTVLNDGSSPSDATYLQYTAPSGNFSSQFTVNVDDPTGVVEPTGSLILHCRIKTYLGDADWLKIKVELLDGAVVRSSIDASATSFTTFDLTVPCASISNINGLTVRVTAHGSQLNLEDDNAKAYVSWIRVDFPIRNFTSSHDELTSITDAVADGAYSTDIDNQNANNYKYDLNGNLIKDIKGGVDTIKYDYRNVPCEIKRGTIVTNYRYDANGNRTYKSVPNSQVNYYLYDVSGKQFAILKGDGTLERINLNGLDNFGYITVGY
jgi:hypothetical protein